MKKIQLDNITTYQGFADSRYADITVEKAVPAGTLEPLVAYLNAQPYLRAVPAYDEKNQQHLLRISGFSDDDTLQPLLTSGFDAWQKQDGISDKVSLSMVQPQREQNDASEGMGNFFKDHATILASLCFVSGNLGVLYSAMTATPEHCDIGRRRDIDWMKAYCSIAYNISSGILLALAPSIDTERSPDDVAKNAAQRAFRHPETGLSGMVEHAVDFMRKHPWEVSAAISLSGSAAYIASIAKNYNKTQDAGLIYEGLSVLGSITALAITVLMPDAKEAEAPPMQAGESLEDTAMRMQQHLPEDRPSLEQRIKDFAHHATTHPLMLASIISGGTNVIRTTAALKKEHKDGGLLFSSGAYMLGNIVQSQGRKAKAPDVADVVLATANVLRRSPEYGYETQAQLDMRIKRMAETLSDMHDVKESSQEISHLLSDAMSNPISQTVRINTEALPEGSPFIETNMEKNKPLSYVQKLALQAHSSLETSLMR